MTHIEQRLDTAANWTAANPVLHFGEAGHESDTGKWKLGNGLTPWNALPYKTGVDSVAGRTGAVVLNIGDIAGVAPLASPALTGTPTAPTPGSGDISTRLATTEYVQAQKVSPAFTGTPTAPTQANAANGTSLATTAFVKNQDYAPRVSPALSGAPTAPTQAATDDSTRLATTGYVKSQGYTTPATAISAVFQRAQSGQASGSFPNSANGQVTVIFPTPYPVGVSPIVVANSVIDAWLCYIISVSRTQVVIGVRNPAGTAISFGFYVNWHALG